MNRSHVRSSFGISIAFFLAVVFYSLLIPFNQAPDEVTHFFLVEYLYKFHSLPQPLIEPASPFTGLLSGQVFDRTTFWYFGLPFTHVIGAWITSFLAGPFLPEPVAYLAARAFNWLLAIPFAFCMASLGRSLGARRGIGLLAAALVLSIPQVVFVFSYFNADGLGLFAVAFALLTFQRFRSCPSLKRAAFFGIGVGLVLQTKLYFFPSLIYFTISYLYTISTGRSGYSGKLAAMILAFASVTAAPMLIITYANFGEMLGVSGQIYFTQLNASNMAAGWGTCFFACGDRLIEWSTTLPWVMMVFRSFFAVFGYMNVFLPEFFYNALFPYLVLLLSGGSAFFCAREFRKRKVDRDLVAVFEIGLFWAMLAGTIAMSLVSSQTTLPQPQGRYLFVVIPFMPLVIAMLLSVPRPGGQPRGCSA